MHYTRTECRLKFAQLNEQAEREYLSDPDKYKRKILLLGLLGYLVIGFLFLLAAGTLATTIWLLTFGFAVFVILLKTKILFLLLPAIWFIFKSVWVKIPAPSGYVLTRKDFPLLHHHIRKLEDELSTPKIHQIVLIPEMNASIAQTPKLGIFGWQQNTLCLGLELLMTLNLEECQAVIAHEMGHLSASHSRFNNWVYRVRQIWGRIDASLQQNDSIFTKPLRAFFAWYSLYFGGYSFALARLNEYEADAIAAQLEGKNSLASALGLTDIVSDAAGSGFWPKVWEQSTKRHNAPTDIYQQLYAFIRKTREGAKESDLSVSMAMQTTAENTHPCFKDRLAALGITSPIVLPSEIDAASIFMGERLADLIAFYSREWEQSVTHQWQDEYEYAQELQVALSKIDVSDAEAMTLTQAHIWLDASSNQVDKEFDLRLLEQLQHKFTEDSALRLQLAKRLHTSDALRAEELYNELLSDFALKEVALLGLIDINTKQKNHDEVENRQRQLDAHYDHCESLDKKWNEINKKDQLHVPKLSEEEIQFLQDALTEHKKLKSIWIAKRELPSEFTTPAYIVLVSTKGFMVSRAKIVESLAEKLGKKLAVFVIDKDFEYKSIIKKVKANGLFIAK